MTITPEVAAQARADFEDDWNRLNLVRTLAIGAGFAALAAAGVLLESRDEQRRPTVAGQTG